MIADSRRRFDRKGELKKGGWMGKGRRKRGCKEKGWKTNLYKILNSLHSLLHWSLSGGGEGENH